MRERFATALATMFRAYPAGDADAARFRARQIQAILRLTPLVMPINLLNVLVVFLAVWSEPIDHTALLAWSAVVTMLALMGFRGWWHAHLESQRAFRDLHISLATRRGRSC